MRRWSALPFGLGAFALAACNAILGFDDLERVDASSSSDAGRQKSDGGKATGEDDATAEDPTIPSQPCNVDAPFGTPVAVGGATVQTTEDESPPTLTAAERELVYQRGTDIFGATRSDRDAGFEELGIVLNTVEQYVSRGSPTTTSNGLLLVFAGRREGESGSKLFVTQRNGPQAGFAEPASFKAVNASDSEETNPSIMQDGAELWFSSDREGIANVRHLFKATQLPDGGYTGASLVNELRSAASEAGVALSWDGLTIYFGSTRAPGDGLSDIWVAQRPSLGDPFGAARRVPELNSPGNDVPGWLSKDRCRLYFASNRNGNADIFVASRTPE